MYLCAGRGTTCPCRPVQAQLGHFWIDRPADCAFDRKSQSRASRFRSDVSIRKANRSDWRIHATFLNNRLSSPEMMIRIMREQVVTQPHHFLRFSGLGCSAESSLSGPAQISSQSYQHFSSTILGCFFVSTQKIPHFSERRFSGHFLRQRASTLMIVLNTQMSRISLVAWSGWCCAGGWLRNMGVVSAIHTQGRQQDHGVRHLDTLVAGLTSNCVKVLGESTIQFEITIDVYQNQY